jgi:DNA-binding transcriptional regulator LsrR (DeoR family)
MARQLILAIAESAESLEQQLKNSRTASQKERLQMLWWLKTGQVTQHQTLAERLGRDRSTVTRWLQKYRQGGLPQLLAIKSAPGKAPHLSLLGAGPIARKTGTATRLQKLWGARGVAQSDLPTEPDISHSL